MICFYLLPLLYIIKHALAKSYRNDLTNNGPYEIARCGAGQPDSRASRLQNLLQETGFAITNLIIPFAKKGVVGSRYFANFFKTDQNIDQVVSLY